MRTFLAPLALAAALAVPAAAENARFLKIDIVGKSMKGHHGHRQDGPTEVHLRTPLALAKGVLEMAGDTEIKVNGETRKGMKPEALIKLLEGAKPGDLLLELTTDKGDLVKITVE